MSHDRPQDGGSVMAMNEATREVGVILRRRSIDNPWIDHNWSPTAILDEVPATAPWTVLSNEPDATLYYAGAASIDLFSSDTANYRDNRADAARNRGVDRSLCRSIPCRARVPQAQAGSRGRLAG